MRTDTLYHRRRFATQIRELKQRRRRRQRERQKINRFSLAKRQKMNFARASRFFVHFFAVTARLQREKFSRFVEDVNTRQRLPFSFPELTSKERLNFP